MGAHQDRGAVRRIQPRERRERAVEVDAARSSGYRDRFFACPQAA